MSEVLSQSQIDALLAAARNGDMDMGTAEKDKSEEKRYPKYDFYSPKKFTRDRLKMISSVFESYVRILSSRLNAMLHMSCELEVDSVEEQRYFEFSNALSERDVLTLAEDSFDDAVEKEPILFHVTTGIMLSMMDRMLGGDGDVENEINSDYQYTDIELRLYKDFMTSMVDSLSSAWKNYIDINFKYQRVEVNPTLVQLIGLEEAVVIVGITIRTPVSRGRFSIVLPGTMLSDVFGLMNRETASVRQASQRDSEEIMDFLRVSDLEITAEFQHTTLRLEDIYHLHVGDVIFLDQPKDSNIFLNIGGKRWFDGKLGVFQKNKAVRIDKTYVLSEMENTQDEGERQ